MNSASRKPFLSSWPGLTAGLALGALLCAPARAEDPLLGRIKVIKCVGCNPGSVNLVIHDPIDVRDFEVQIQESDYQKIITPLAGKTVYDKEGCFYWMEPSKDVKKEAPKGAAKDSAKDGKDGKDAAKVADGKAGKKGAKKDPPAPGSDSAGDGLLPTSAPPPASAEPQGTPSRCIPFTRVEVKPTHPPGSKQDD
jgi:hypothetical protein